MDPARKRVRDALTQEQLKSVLRYNRTTGVFVWIARPGAGSLPRIGTQAGTHHRDNRIVITIKGISYQASRLAWLYVTGRWPVHEVDHKNGNSAQNRWSNLRDVPRTVNQENLRVAHKDRSNNLPLGVRHQKGSRINPYTAYIVVQKKIIYLGCFPTPRTAHRAYVAAKRKLHKGCTI